MYSTCFRAQENGHVRGLFHKKKSMTPMTSMIKFFEKANLFKSDSFLDKGIYLVLIPQLLEGLVGALQRTKSSFLPLPQKCCLCQ